MAEESTYKLIASVSFESNLEAAKETTAQIAKQDSLVTELTAHQKELAAQIEKSSDPTVIAKLTKEYEKSEKAIAKTQKTIQDQITKTAATIEKSINGIDFGKFKNIFTGSEFNALDEQIGNAKTDMAQLAILTEALKGKLSNLDAGTAEFQELSAVIQISEQTLKEFGTAAEISEGKVKPLKTQMRELKDRMSEMELAGKANTAEFKAMQSQAGALKDQLDATGQRVKILSSDTKNIDFGVEAIQAVTAGFEVAAGAAALLGVNEEDLQRVQTKLIALMAIANGIQQIKNALQKENILRVVGSEVATNAAAVTQRLYNSTLKGSVISLKAFRGALIATGIGAAAVAIGYLVANWEELSEAFSKTSKEQRNYHELQSEAVKNSAKEVANLTVLKSVVEDTTISQTKRNAAVKELQKTFPEYFAHLDAEKIKNGQVSDAYDLTTKAILRRAAATVAQSKVEELIGQQLELERKKQILLKKGADAEIKAQAETSKKDQALIRSKEEVQKAIRANTVEAVTGLINERKELQKQIDFYLKFAKDGFVINPEKVKENVKEVKKAINKEGEKDPPTIKVKLEPIEIIGGREIVDNTPISKAKDTAEKISKEDEEEFKRIQKERAEAKKKQDADDLQRSQELFVNELSYLGSQANAIIQLEIEKSDRLIEIQKKRLADAQSNQDGANDTNVKAERDRLEQLQAEREKALKGQRVIDAALIALNQAVAISAAVKGISIAAAEGGAAAPFTIAANVAAIIAGLAAVGIGIRNALSDIPEFYDGGYTGDGNPRERSTALGNRPYNYHKGEFVMPHELTAQYRDVFEGLHSKDLKIVPSATGYSILPSRLDVGAIAKDHSNIKMYYANASNNVMEDRLKSIESVLREKNTTVNTTLDAKGFALTVKDTLGRIKMNDSRR